jgi:hypothetical protein
MSALFQAVPATRWQAAIAANKEVAALAIEPETGSRITQRLPSVDADATARPILRTGSPAATPTAVAIAPLAADPSVAAVTPNQPSALKPVGPDTSSPPTPKSGDSPETLERHHFDPEHGRVGLGAVTTTSGLSGASVRKGLSHASFARCYREALKAKGASAVGNASLFIAVDDTGYVVSATLKGAEFLPGMRGCVESAARATRIPDVDTGDATATVALEFSLP